MLDALLYVPGLGLLGYGLYAALVEFMSIFYDATRYAMRQFEVEPGGEAVSSILLLGLLLLAGVAILQTISLVCGGRTLGKRALGLRSVPLARRSAATAVCDVLLRVLVPFAAGADVLLFVRADRRCVHDLFGGTVVVDTRS